MVFMIFPVGFFSRWFAWLGGGVFSLELGNPGVSDKSPCGAQLPPNSSHVLLTLAVYTGIWKRQVVGLLPRVGRGRRQLHSSSPGPHGPGPPGKIHSFPFTEEDAETQEDYGCPLNTFANFS